MKQFKSNVKIISLILVIVMCFGILVGCIPNGNNGDDNQGNNSTGNNNGGGNGNGGSDVVDPNPTPDPNAPHVCSYGSWTIVKEPTNEADGLKERKCECGKVEQEVIKASDTEHFIIYRNLKTADYPEQNGYNSSEGLLDLPHPTAEGYSFIGWYTASIGGDLVDYIPKGSSADYVLYAHWDLITYDITYKNAPNNTNPISYNIESKLKLETPKWSGLVFTHWSDDNGNIYSPDENITALPENMYGDLTLTANWKVLRNIATPAGEGAELKSSFAGDDGFLYFFYDLGTIEHVVLDNINPDMYYKYEGLPITLTLSKTVSISEEKAESIAQTVSKSVSTTSSWEGTKSFSETNSSNWNAHIGGSIEGEVGSGKLLKNVCNWSVKMKVEGSYDWGGEESSTEGWTNSMGGSSGETDTTSNTVSTSIAYKEEITTEITESITISSDLPSGYYAYVHAGNIRVIAVLSYEISTGCLYVNTYSRLDNMHSMIMYYPNVNELNNPAVEGLDFTIPEDEIVNMIENSYYVKYDANGGEGTMPTTLHSVDGNQKLAKNTFTKTGCLFAGWELETKDGVKILLDEESVTNIGVPLETVTLKALWTGDPAYDKDVVYTLTTKTGSYASEPQMRYSALIEYRNRTADSVEIRITWTSIKDHGYNSYGQNFEFSCGGVGSGGVRICGWDGLQYGYASVTKASGWVKISLNTAAATSIKLAIKYWQTDSYGNWYNEKMNTTWTVDIPAAK